MRLLLFGLALAVIIFLATNGHVLFLPLLLFLPLGLMGRRRRRRVSRW
jgi:hypothetical protein